MFINKFLDKLRLIRSNRTFRKNATILGKDIKFDLYAQLHLSDGSTKEDVIISDKCTISGILCSQNHGKIKFGYCSKIGSGAKILSCNEVVIGDYTAVAVGTTICDNNNHPLSPDYRLYMRTTPENDDSRKWRNSANAPIRIGKNCWIGTNVRICKGVTIGDNSIIAACSVVTKDVPANCIAAGNPAKVVKTDIDNVEAPTTCEGYNEYVRNKKQ